MALGIRFQRRRGPKWRTPPVQIPGSAGGFPCRASRLKGPLSIRSISETHCSLTWNPTNHAQRQQLWGKQTFLGSISICGGLAPFLFAAFWRSQGPSQPRGRQLGVDAQQPLRGGPLLKSLAEAHQQAPAEEVLRWARLVRVWVCV